MPLPLLPQHGIRHIIQMDPLPGLGIPAATRGNDVQMRMVLPVAAMRLDDHDIAPLEGAATGPAEDIIQASHPTAQAWTQHHLGLLIKVFLSISGTVRTI